MVVHLLFHDLLLRSHLIVSGVE